MISAQNPSRIGSTILVLLLTSSCAGPQKPDENSLPVYHVEKSGVSRDAAKRLGQSLYLDKEILAGDGFPDKNGRIYFLDRERHQFVPGKRLSTGKADEDGQPTTAETLDLKALKSLPVMDEGKAKDRYLGALKNAGLLPPDSRPRVTHNRLKVIDGSGKLLADAALDTRVVVDTQLGDYPLEGPGSKLSISYDGAGRVTRLKHAARQLKRGESVAGITEAQARQRCTDAFKLSLPAEQHEALKVETRLFYYAPPLSKVDTHTIIPYFECSATTMMEKQRVELLQQMIPAIDDPRYVPRLSIDATVKGAVVQASAQIQGGTPPYEIRWASAGTALAENDKHLAYTIAHRKGAVGEVLTLNVVDANGVFAGASKTLPVDPAAVTKVIDFSLPAVAGMRDFGAENPVVDQFGGLAQGFVDEMMDDGVTRRFHWLGTNAWEQDFKADGDSQWIDNSDITFYVGHGNVGRFTFVDSSHDDSVLDNDDATGDWGDRDLEWLALYSCKVLGRGSDGFAPFDNWKQEFDGLHLLLGFHTNAQATSAFSETFASNLLDSRMTVRQAWFEAIDDHQPSDRVGVVMGVLSRGDWVWDYNDHFHGKGSVGPDIRGSDIAGYWYATGP